jgi:hypothetical protein
MKLYGSVMALGKDEVDKLVGTEKGIYDAVGRIGEAETALSTARGEGRRLYS